VGLKVRLDWYDKKTDVGVGEELSKDFGDDGSVIEALGIPIENNINHGGFNVTNDWTNILQTHFTHTINLALYDYQVSFDYCDHW
jgi:hypothetical protein